MNYDILNYVIVHALVPWLHINGHDTWEKDFNWNKPCLWSNQELYDADITLPHHLCLEEWWEQENRVWHQLFGFYMQIILPSPYDSLCAQFRLKIWSVAWSCVFCVVRLSGQVMQSKLWAELSYPLAFFNSVLTLCWKSCQNCLIYYLLELLLWQSSPFYSTVQIWFLFNRQTLFREVQGALEVWKYA